MFEECYHELLNLPKYAELKERFRNPVEKVHDGYFSQDKRATTRTPEAIPRTTQHLQHHHERQGMAAVF